MHIAIAAIADIQDAPGGIRRHAANELRLRNGDVFHESEIRIHIVDVNVAIGKNILIMLDRSTRRDREGNSAGRTSANRKGISAGGKIGHANIYLVQASESRCESREIRL